MGVKTLHVTTDGIDFHPCLKLVGAWREASDVACGTVVACPDMAQIGPYTHGRGPNRPLHPRPCGAVAQVGPYTHSRARPWPKWPHTPTSVAQIAPYTHGRRDVVEAVKALLAHISRLVR